MKVVPTPHFQKDVKFYLRKKHYSKIMDDIKGVVEELEKGNLLGDQFDDIKVDGMVYKVRAVNASINVGKSNGFRIIYYVVSEDGTIYLLTIYSKKDDIKIPTDKEIVAITKTITN
jgi:mRNA-degrading endonuclease RelE of RelBE toxin-antitoxin system